LLNFQTTGDAQGKYKERMNCSEEQHWSHNVEDKLAALLPEVESEVQQLEREIALEPT
jgi:hypothetical protein